MGSESAVEPIVFDACDGCDRRAVLLPRPRRFHGEPPAGWRRNNFYCAACLAGDPKRMADPMYHVFPDRRSEFLRAVRSVAWWCGLFAAGFLLAVIYFVGAFRIAQLTFPGK